MLRNLALMLKETLLPTTKTSLPVWSSDTGTGEAVQSSARPIPGRRLEPGRNLTDPAFRYISAANTDVKKTFARVRREMRKAA